MSRILLIILFAFLSAACSFKAKIYITCDNTCEDPILFVDNEKIGVASELNNSGTYFLYVDNGARNIMLINSDGRIYKKEIYVKGEDYLFVSFKMIDD